MFETKQDSSKIFKVLFIHAASLQNMRNIDILSLLKHAIFFCRFSFKELRLNYAI